MEGSGGSGGRPLVRVIGAVWRSHPWRSGLLAGLILAGGALAVALTVATGAVVGAVPAAARAGLGSSAGHRLLLLLAVFGVAYTAQFVVGHLIQPLGVSLGLRFALFVRESVMAATSQPVGTAHLDDPATAGELGMIENAEVRQAASRMMVPGLSSLGAAWVAGIGQAVILGFFAWWAPLLILAAAWGTRRWIAREVANFLHAQQMATASLRRSNYLREVALGNAAAKELRVFGLGQWSVQAFGDLWHRAMADVWVERHSSRKTLLAVAPAFALAYGLVFYAIGQAAIGGQVSLGHAAAYSSAALGMFALVYGGDTETLVRQGSGILARALHLAQRMPARAHTAHVPLPWPAADGIRFEGVSFSYPGSSRPVLAGLDLEIPCGRSLAIVGENGAGKTTLIKLLSRLEEPTAGAVTAGGVPLAGVDPAEWRSHLAVIFQDFVHYELSLRDNVGLGAPRLLEDQDALYSALVKAGGARLVDQVGWDRPLSPAYEGGVDLSGGQWQRVALARALAAVEGGADVLVLDEPTANLDVRAEAELFERFLELTSGLTTVLISHRFSSVRRADRICVLEEGRVVESGSHDELMATRGRYAHMFNLQASRFEAASG